MRCASCPEVATSELPVDQNIDCATRVCSANAIDGHVDLCARHIIDPRSLGVRRKQNSVHECDQLIAFHEGKADEHVTSRANALIGDQADLVKTARLHTA